MSPDFYNKKVHILEGGDIKMGKSKERIITLDMARIVAILAVVMIHASAKLVISYSTNTKEFVLGNFFDSISRVGVPLFLMISGALMLDENKEITMETILKKNIKNIVILLIAWLLIYSTLFSLIINPMLYGDTINLKSVVGRLYSGHYHMWYLYMIIGMYLITPYLRCFVRREKKNMVLCFIAVSLVAQFIAPVTDILSSFWQPFAYISSFISKFNLKFFCGYPVYYLTGWYIVHIGFDKKIMKYGIYIASILSVIITFLAVQITGDYNNGYSNTNIFIFMYSVGVFYALFNMKIELNQRKEYIIEMMSKLTFGVYIVHPIFLDVLKVIIPLTNPLLHIILVFVLTIVISFAVCYIMSKNAITKKLIRM